MDNAIYKQLRELLQVYKNNPIAFVKQCETLIQKENNHSKEALEFLNISHIIAAGSTSQQQQRFAYFSNLKQMDDITGGFATGEIAVIGSRPGMGKTQF